MCTNKCTEFAVSEHTRVHPTAGIVYVQSHTKCVPETYNTKDNWYTDILGRSNITPSYSFMLSKTTTKCLNCGTYYDSTLWKKCPRRHYHERVCKSDREKNNLNWDWQNTPTGDIGRMGYGISWGMLLFFFTNPVVDQPRQQFTSLTLVEFIEQIDVLWRI